MRSNDSSGRLKIRQGAVSAVCIAVLSLFSQWLIWFAYDKLDLPLFVGLLMPLVLCVMYHFVQLDAGGEDCFSRRFFYLFSAIVPFVFCILLTVVIFLANPDISTFAGPDAEYLGTAPEVISIFSGRAIISSLYIIVFGLIDIPILRATDGKRAAK